MGEGEPRQIVCGAWNFGVGATVAVGLPGRLLPGFPAPLDERPLRGELSRGMILAEDEIGLGTDHAGIMLLAGRDRAGNAARRRPAGPRAGARRDPDDEPGRPALDGRPRPRGRDALRRRAACRSTSTTRRSSHPEWVDVDGRGPRRLPALHRARLLERHRRPSPMWLRARLHAAGMRSISNVVDVTNYVMHVYGSPLHAFDRVEARGRAHRRPACARRARRCRRSTERCARVDERDLLITDGEKPVALAAIMGGATARSPRRRPRCCSRRRTSSRSACCSTSERLGLRTEGSNRWEKGIDPYLAEPAAVLASRLIVDLAGAELAGSADVHGGLPARPVVRLRPERTDRARRARGPRRRATPDSRAARLRGLRRVGCDRPDRGGRATSRARST